MGIGKAVALQLARERTDLVLVDLARLMQRLDDSARTGVAFGWFV